MKTRKRRDKHATAAYHDALASDDTTVSGGDDDGLASLQSQREELEKQCAEQRALIAELNAETDALEEQCDEVRRLWADKRKDTRRLVESYETLTTQKANIFFYFERVQFATRTRSLVWWCFVFALKALALGATWGHAWLPMLLLEYAFILNFRSLFVRHTPHAKPVGALILLVCAYMFFWPTSTTTP